MALDLPRISSRARAAGLRVYSRLSFLFQVLAEADESAVPCHSLHAVGG